MEFIPIAWIIFVTYGAIYRGWEGFFLGLFLGPVGVVCAVILSIDRKDKSDHQASISFQTQVERERAAFESLRK
jgi:hypothetical protein